jgi:Galactose oxidase, central domain
MNHARFGHQATLLEDGTVLIIGGSSAGVTLASMEIYDPNQSGTFTQIGDMTTARFSHAATLLNDGRVLILGGEDNNYNGISSSWNL